MAKNTAASKQGRDASVSRLSYSKPFLVFLIYSENFALTVSLVLVK